MLNCPACHRTINPEGHNQWFQCARCGCWLRLRVNSSTNKTWLQPGIHANGQIRAVRIVSYASNDTKESATPSTEYQQTAPGVKMTLESVQAERLELSNQFSQLEAEIQRLAGVIGENRGNTANILKANQDITKLTALEEEVKNRDEELQKLETELQEEKDREAARQKKAKNNHGWAFGCSTSLFAVGLFAFGETLHATWGAGTFLSVLGISMAGGFFLWLGYILMD